MVADHARKRGLKRAVMENLFAVAELTAKGLLLLMPDERLLDSKSHRFIGRATNAQGHLGNSPTSFVEALNEGRRCACLKDFSHNEYPLLQTVR